MDNTFYLAAAQQTALTRNMSVIANNIANANTTGYKSEKIIFKEFLLKADASEAPLSFVHDVTSVRDVRQGSLQQTLAPLDMAIQGEGYFKVRTPKGDVFTRAGNFALNAKGEVVTAQGYPLLGASGETLQVPEGATNFFVREDGMIQVFNVGAEEEVGQVGVSVFDQPLLMEALGGGFYRGEGAKQAVANSYRIVQGAIEESNVNSVYEMTQMIEVSRAVESAARMAKDMDDLVRDAVQRIGKVN